MHSLCVVPNFYYLLVLVLRKHGDYTLGFEGVLKELNTDSKQKENQRFKFELDCMLGNCSLKTLDAQIE